MKKLSLLLILLFCWNVYAAWGYDVKVDGIYYNLDSDSHTASVTFDGLYYDYPSPETRYIGDVVVPKEISVNGIKYAVTSLGGECFRGCTGLTSITIPSSVTSLGRQCFWGCTGLTSITIPSSVTSLSHQCFAHCSSIEYIKVDANNPVYDSRDNCNAIIETSTNEMIAGCKNSHIPSSVTSLGDDCFRGCTGLTSITIPSFVTNLGRGCFANCSGIEYIKVDANNPVYDSRDNCNAIIKTSTNEMIAGCKNSHIPSSVTSLGDDCFMGCTGLTSITIPSSVTSMGDFCFHSCTGLTSITIPSSVTSLGKSCFYRCTGLISITIPSSVTSLGDYCFSECNGLTSITIPSSVTRLANDCFSNCSGLTSVTIPSSVTSLGGYCFDGCTGLTSITIPNSVTSLAYACFRGTRLTSITIPSSVTFVGDFCFGLCRSLEEITMLPTALPEAGGDYIFQSTPLLRTIYVANDEAKVLYESARPWKYYDIVSLNIDAGVSQISSSDTAPQVTGYYDLSGRLTGKQRGVVIERYADGTSRKVLVK